MLTVLTLLTMLNFADANVLIPRAHPIAIAPDARRAIVRVSLGDRFTIASCPVDYAPTFDLSFTRPGSLESCRMGEFVSDTAEHRARIDEVLAGIVAKHERILADRTWQKPFGRIFGRAAVVGALTYVASSFRGFGLLRAERLEAVLGFTILTAMTGAIGERMHLQYRVAPAVVMTDPNLFAQVTRDQGSLLLINDGGAFTQVERTLAAVFAKVAAEVTTENGAVRPN